MERKAVSGIMLTLMLTCMLALAFNIQPIKASTTIVSVDPLISTALVGETFTINITVTDVANLYGGQFNLTFSPAILSVSRVTEGPLLKEFGETTLHKSINNSAGYVMAASSFDIPYPPEGVYGNGTLASVTFKVNAAGQTPLQFNRTTTKLLTIWEGWPVHIEHEARDGFFSNLVISSGVYISPDSLNLRSRGQWITAYIQLPEDYNTADIDASTILLNGTISPVLDSKYGFVTDSSEYLVDHNNDGILERMVKFDRATLASLIYESVGMQSDVTLTITGKLFDGTQFEGTYAISAFWAGQRSPCKR